MFKNIKEFTAYLLDDTHPILFLKWMFFKVILILTTILIILGIATIIGFYYNIATFNQRLTTPNAVILYRSKLPTKLTKQESIEWAKVVSLGKKLNKVSRSLRLSKEKKLELSFGKH